MAVALALIASVCWGVADFMGGSLSRRHPLLVVVLVSQAVGLAGVVVVAAVRSGGYDSGTALPGVLAGLAGVVAVSSFYRSMTLGAISVAAPILATSAVVPVVVGLATGERPSAVQMAGIAAALAGVALVSREPSAGGGTVRGAGHVGHRVRRRGPGRAAGARARRAARPRAGGVAGRHRQRWIRGCNDARLPQHRGGAGIAVSPGHGRAGARAAARAPQQWSAGRGRPGAGRGGCDRRWVRTMARPAPRSRSATPIQPPTGVSM